MLRPSTMFYERVRIINYFDRFKILNILSIYFETLQIEYDNIYYM